MRDTYGITTFKVKVGRRPVDLDTAVVRALREGLGDDVELYVDGNRGWTAVRVRPGPAGDGRPRASPSPRSCARPTTCSAGAGWCSSARSRSSPTRARSPPAEVTREVLGGSATAVSIKTARTGFTASQRIHHLCEGLGLEVVMGNQIDGQLGSHVQRRLRRRVRAHLRRAGELSNFLDMSDDLLTEPLQISGGELAVRPGAGLGIDIDEDKLAHYRTTRHLTPSRIIRHHQGRTRMTADDHRDHRHAAASGANATERLHPATSRRYEAVADTPPERVDTARPRGPRRRPRRPSASTRSPTTSTTPSRRG